jgi:hypothetical protein
MTDTSTLTEFDLTELVSFEWKAEWEGSKRYAYENWDWSFESAELNERAKTYAGFRQILREHAAAIEAWGEAHREDGCDLINAHRHEQDRRRENACLWAVRRNDGQIFPEESRERAEYFLRPGRASDGLSFVLLARDEPGGEWREVNPAADLDAVMAELDAVQAELNAGAAIMAANIQSLEAFVAESRQDAEG